VKTLDRKLIREVIHLRGQVVAITLVVACGVASFVAMRSTYNSLRRPDSDVVLLKHIEELINCERNHNQSQLCGT
jgi:hypothetical protein